MDPIKQNASHLCDAGGGRMISTHSFSSQGAPSFDNGRMWMWAHRVLLYRRIFWVCTLRTRIQSNKRVAPVCIRADRLPCLARLCVGRSTRCGSPPPPSTRTRTSVQTFKNPKIQKFKNSKPKAQSSNLIQNQRLNNQEQWEMGGRYWTPVCSSLATTYTEQEWR